VNRFRYWLPIKNLADVPVPFYLPKRFDWPAGYANLDPALIRTPYDAFRLFFSEEVYAMLISSSIKNLEKRQSQVQEMY
jgi:hypothetical protein